MMKTASATLDQYLWLRAMTNAGADVNVNGKKVKNLTMVDQNEHGYVTFRYEEA